VGELTPLARDHVGLSWKRASGIAGEVSDCLVLIDIWLLDRVFRGGQFGGEARASRTLLEVPGCLLKDVCSTLG